MRLTGGSAGGRAVRGPADDAIRPTSDRVRQALFNILGPVEGLAVLDLFAGTGLLGLEALSREAAGAVFVDQSRRAVQLIRRNLDDLDFARRGEIWPIAAEAALAKAVREERRFDLVFADPPYAGENERILGEFDAWRAILAEDARVAWECAARRPAEIPASGWEIVDERRYGDTLLFLLRLTRNAGEGSR
ncbi:MAG: 16S rRNA (guanine(966)-N(2))-methyltransferase RsmD [Myxococcales bacterium]|nr:MAG: 16S rRNA (guanine(966)-N(2))-methyltransferase RsmD [Myxococcales bacterium]